MAGTGRLQADPLFQGLTRPAMIMGVSYLYFVLNACCCLLVFIQTTDMLVLFLIAPVIHGVGYLICLKEPRTIELVMVKCSTCMRVNPLNRRFYGNNNSYDFGEDIKRKE